MLLGPNVVVAERFRLNRQLGRGGMGTVWHASDMRLDKACAVKFIEGEFAAMPEAHSRFQREAKAAAALNSPHVVTIYDHGVWEGTPYIAMELLEGEDLGKRLARVGRIRPAECVAILTQVQRALTKAHAAGIVHRDLKPDNIFLVRDDDDRELAKVLDFGIAKSATASLDGSNTKTGAMLGTPYYMSPEQAQGIKAVDHRSDLWSLGVIVFQALTGRLPFESEALGDLLVKIIVAPPPVPSQLVHDLPSGFDDWWRKASQRDPSSRFQTAKELVDNLRSALALGASSANESTGRLGAGQTPAGTTGATLHQSGGGYGQAGGHSPAQAGIAAPAVSQSGLTPAGVGPVAGTFSGQHVTASAKGGANKALLWGGIGVAALAVAGVTGVAMTRSGGAPGAAGVGPASAGVTASAATAPTPSEQPPAPLIAPVAPAPLPSPTSVVAAAAAPSASAPAAASTSVALTPPIVKPSARVGGGAHFSGLAAASKPTTVPASTGPKKQDLGF